MLKFLGASKGLLVLFMTGYFANIFSEKSPNVFSSDTLKEKDIPIY